MSDQLAIPLAPGAFPAAPSARPTEQRTLPITGTLEARYQAWRATPEGVRAFEAIVDEAVGLEEEGVQRLSAKALVESVRARLKIQINNVFTALIAREIADRIPYLGDLLEFRRRRSA